MTSRRQFAVGCEARDHPELGSRGFSPNFAEFVTATGDEKVDVETTFGAAAPDGGIDAESPSVTGIDPKADEKDVPVNKAVRDHR